jgi:transposase
MELLERRGMPEVWRRSVAEALAVIEPLDERIAPLDRELGPLARADRRVSLLSTIPGIGPVLGLTIAAGSATSPASLARASRSATPASRRRSSSRASARARAS